MTKRLEAFGKPLMVTWSDSLRSTDVVLLFLIACSRAQPRLWSETFAMLLRSFIPPMHCASPPVIEIECTKEELMKGHAAVLIFLGSSLRQWRLGLYSTSKGRLYHCKVRLDKSSSLIGDLLALAAVTLLSLPFADCHCCATNFMMSFCGVPA